MTNSVECEVLHLKYVWKVGAGCAGVDEAPLRAVVGTSRFNLSRTITLPYH